MHRGLSALSFFALFYFSTAVAAPIPQGLKDFIQKELQQELQRFDFIGAFENIPVLSPQQYIERFSATLPAVVGGAGFNGIIFRDAQGGANKFTYSIYGAFGKVEVNPFLAEQNRADYTEIRKNWAELFTKTHVGEIDIAKFRKNPEQVGCQPVREDLIGTLLWSAFSPTPVDFPSFVSSDGLASRSKYIQGHTVRAILESEREGGTLHQAYNLSKVWKEIVKLQTAIEKMRDRIGLAIDTVSPANILVVGDPKDPKVVAIDHALIQPTEQAYEYLRSQGIHVPSPPTIEGIRLIRWPFAGLHIVTSRLWDMNFKQALDYLQALYPALTHTQHLLKLATSPRFDIAEAKHLNNYSNLDQACSELVKLSD